MKYSVDTSALIDAWVRYYPPDVFDTLWKRMDALVAKGHFRAVDEVRRELEKQDDQLFKWVEIRPKMLVPLDTTIQRAATVIINDHRFSSLTKTKSIMQGSADAFVIALAQVQELSVVTAEKSRPTRPRIPDVCNALGIKCITLVEMFRNEGWQV